MNAAATSQFRSLDPDLPSIAALAAAEIDGLLRHEPSQLRHLFKLADVLKTSFDDRPRGSGSRRLLDPVSITVLASAGGDALSNEMTSYDELASASLELAKQMSHATEQMGNEHLLVMKRFCLALSRHALARLPSSESLSRAPDYKR